MSPVLLTRTEAAVILRCSARQVKRMQDSGELDAVHVGRKVFVPVGALEALVGFSLDAVTLERLVGPVAQRTNGGARHKPTPAKRTRQRK